MSNNYQRLFYILKNMDSDVGHPTGYIKVEINCEAAKIQISLNNLLNRRGLIYQLYGIKKSDKQLIYTVICDIPNENGRADVKINADILSVGSSKLRLEDINIFAIITQLPNSTASIKCPLVAYTKGEVLWEKEFVALILNKNLPTSEENIAKNVQMNPTKSAIESNSTSENTGETIDVGGFEKKSTTEQQPNIIAELGLFQETNKATEVSVAEGNEEIQLLDDKQVLILGDVKNKGNDTYEEKMKGEENVTKILEEVQTDTSQEAGNGGTYILGNMEKYEADISDIIEDNEVKVSKDMQTDKVEVLEAKENFENTLEVVEDLPPKNVAESTTDNKFKLADKFEATITNIYNKHKPTMLGQESASEVVLADNDILSSVQKNFNDISSIEIDTNKAKSELNIPNMKEELDKSFENFNPFKMKSKNFKWWKINSPGYLNNILFRHSIKTYLLFNPKVMLAHYKYRYIIFGIRNDKHLGKEYLICGVPGVYSIDENPFGNMASWAQIEGYKPKYGAFGYWIILIDPRTGKLIKGK